MGNRNDMQLIMEDWRRFLNEDDGKTPAQLITDFEAAEETLKSVKDEKTRKEFLGKLFVGVSFLAFSIYFRGLNRFWGRWLIGQVRKVRV